MVIIQADVYMFEIAVLEFFVQIKTLIIIQFNSLYFMQYTIPNQFIEADSIYS